MRPGIIIGVALFAQLALNGNVAMPQDAARIVTLQLAEPLAPGASAWIEVQVGPVGSGRRINVTTASGQPLGVISTFGTRTGQDAGTYPLPVPRDAFRDGRLSVSLTITQAGAPPRAPTPDEVRSVKLGVAPPPQ
jgi:hypothetical protein